MANILQLPISVLGIPDVTVEGTEITRNDEFIITVKSTKQEIKCKQCNSTTALHGHGRVIRLRHLPIFNYTTYINIAPARGICKNCDDHPTTTQSHDWYNAGSPYTKIYERKILMLLIN